MKITVVGLGYVGMSMAVLFADKHCVIAADISGIRVDAVNNKSLPLRTSMLNVTLSRKPSTLKLLRIYQQR
jgi:UDPglucose 6-dehydrogenase